MKMSGYDACKEWLKGKNVTVMGLGLLGRGVGDVAFFAEHAAHVTVTDLKTEEQLASSVVQLVQYKNITFHLGGHEESDFTSADIVCKAAGVPLDSPYIAAARNAGKEVVMSAAVFAKYATMSGARILGITGTRGKTTTSYLIYHALKEVNIPARLGGNILGVSTIQFLKDVKLGEVFVLELDSWQLQGFGDLRISPHLAVFTTLLEDHINYYKDQPQQYLHDKAQIFLHQDVDDILILGKQCADTVLTAYAGKISGRVVKPEPILSDGVQLRIIGNHNIYNAALARSALHELGVEEDEVMHALSTFPGVFGRLEVVWKEEVYDSPSESPAGNPKGRMWINDTTATTPDALHVGVSALIESGQKSIVLITGGADKQLSLGKAVEALKMAQVRILLPGTGTDKLKAELALEGIPYIEAKDMKDAVDRAQKSTVEVHADTVILCPGFASFGLFKNEYDRGDAFVREVEELKQIAKK